jgi:hypothetical protein
MAAAVTPADVHGGAMIMRYFIRLLVTTLTFSAVLFLSGCETSGGEYRTVNYDVYSGYGYPYYGNGGYYYDDDDDNHNHDNDDRPDRPDRPIRPDRPTNRPSTRPAMSSGGGMGHPSGMSRGGGGRGGGGRGGGGRGR